MQIVNPAPDPVKAHLWEGSLSYYTLSLRKKVFEHKIFMAVLFQRHALTPGSWGTLFNIYSFSISLWICQGAVCPARASRMLESVSPALPEIHSTGHLQRICFGPGSQLSMQADKPAGAEVMEAASPHVSTSYYICPTRVVGQRKAGTRGEERGDRQWPRFWGHRTKSCFAFSSPIQALTQ